MLRIRKSPPIEPLLCAHCSSPQLDGRFAMYRCQSCGHTSYNRTEFFLTLLGPPGVIVLLLVGDYLWQFVH